MLSVVVCGGREFHDDLVVEITLRTAQVGKGTVLSHGACRGADEVSGRIAKRLGATVREFPANWDLYGKGAGPRRNAEMLATARPDVLIAFPGGRGTADMAGKAAKAGVRVITVVVDAFGAWLERAAILEYEGGLSREQSNERAFELVFGRPAEDREMTGLLRREILLSGNTCKT